MTFYLINIFLLILLGIFFLLGKPSEQSKKVFCIIASLQWILLSGLRHISVGTDNYSYKLSFETTANNSWTKLGYNFIDVMFYGADGKDPGYSLFEKTVQIFTTDYQIYLVMIAAVFTIPLGTWIYKNSSEPFISFLIYSCLFYSFFAITGHRQTIATALAILIGYKFIKDRHFWPFLILVLLAMTIHKSAIVFLPFYFIANKKITRKYIVIISGIILISFIFRNKIMVLLGTLMGYENYIEQYEGAGAWTFTMLLLLMTIVVIWKHKIMLSNNLQVTHYINALFLASVFLPLTFVDPSAMRVVQYYSIFIILLVPEIIKAFNKRERTIVYYVGTTLLISFFAKNNPQYLFFWQGS